jgi:hypothetical protein
LSEVDARRVDADSVNFAVLNKPLCRVRVQAGEMQVFDSRVAFLVGAQIFLLVRPL